jgi:hypothetical protein
LVNQGQHRIGQQELSEENQERPVFYKVFFQDPIFNKFI